MIYKEQDNTVSHLPLDIQRVFYVQYQVNGVDERFDRHVLWLHISPEKHTLWLELFITCKW